MEGTLHEVDVPMFVIFFGWFFGLMFLVYRYIRTDTILLVIKITLAEKILMLYPHEEYEELISVTTDSKSVLTSEEIHSIRREAREVELRIRRNKECEMESLRSRRGNSEGLENSYRDHVYRHESHLSVHVDHPRSNFSAEKLRSRFKEAGCRHSLRSFIFHFFYLNSFF